LTAPPIFQQSEWTCHPELTSAAPFSRTFHAIAKLTGLSRLKEVWEEAGRLDEADNPWFYRHQRERQAIWKDKTLITSEQRI